VYLVRIHNEAASTADDNEKYDDMINVYDNMGIKKPWPISSYYLVFTLLSFELFRSQCVD
jgi:hypothetical protein